MVRHVLLERDTTLSTAATFKTNCLKPLTTQYLTSLKKRDCKMVAQGRQHWAWQRPLRDHAACSRHPRASRNRNSPKQADGPAGHVWHACRIPGRRIAMFGATLEAATYARPDQNSAWAAILKRVCPPSVNGRGG